MKTRRTNKLLALVMGLGMLPMTALAAGDFSVMKEATEIPSAYNSSTYTKDYTISEENASVTLSGSATNGRILVEANNVTINLNGASMLLNECNGSPIEIAAGKTATIVFSGENKLTAYAAGPGILVNQGATLILKETDAGGSNSLTVTGARMASYSPGDGLSGGMASGFAGIGGPNSSSALDYTGTIKIESGTVNAFGYGFGAGIGGGDYCSGGTIEISGGKVTAINGGTDPDGWASSTHKQASGIGASQGQHSGTITISGSAEVSAYGGYACAGIGGGQNNITIKDSAKVTAYGGEKAAGIGGYNQNKGESTITISGTADVTAYGGANASGLGQGSNNTASVKLMIGPSATVLAYCDGTKAAITGTPQSGSASILNMYMQNVSLGDTALPLTLTSDSSETKTVLLAGGYKAVGTMFPAGSYTATVPTGLSGSSYRLVPYSGSSFKVSASDDEAAYSGTRLMLMLVSDHGATIQLNPPNGTIVTSGSAAPLVLDEENGTIVVPAGGSVDQTAYPLGGTLSKSGTFTPAAENYDVWVAGTQVTSANKDDVLEDGGSVQYDPAAKTLTLTDATIENESGNGIQAAGNLTIHGVDTDAEGANTITGSDCAIQATGDITMTGTLGSITGGSSGGVYSTGGNILVAEDAVLGNIASAWYTLQTDAGSITINGEIGNVSGQIGITSESSTGHDTIINGKVGDITGVDHGIFSYGKLNINEGAQVGNISGGMGLLALGDITCKGQVGTITGSTGFGIRSLSGKVSMESVIGAVKTERSTPGIMAIVGATGVELGEKVAIKTPAKSRIALYGASNYTVYDTAGTENTDDDTAANTVEFAAVYTVSFDSKGGSTVASQSVVDGQAAVKPADPTRSGYAFAGWYSDESGTVSYDFTHAVTADITLYAKWTAEDTSDDAPTYTPAVDNTTGGSTTVSDKNPEKGDKVTITTNPDEGHVVGEIAVTDTNGRPVEVIDNGDGTYTYVQPAGRVRITVTYVCDGTHACPSLAYSDLNAAKWYHLAADYVITNGLMNGVDGGRFDPDGTTTRGMIVTILYRLEGEPEVSGDCPFDDVKAGSWYEDAVIWAEARGIVEGYDSGRFGPEDAITREQLAAILYRYAGSPESSHSLNAFPDAGQTGSWARTALAWANENGIVGGYGNGYLGPRDTATRAQVAQMLTNFLDNP